MRDEEQFVCQSPQIVLVTASLAANETSDVMLSCLAAGDPAPEVVWRSPTNDWIGVSPPSDRKQTRTRAFWQLRNVQLPARGWYSCNATNVAGSQTGYTYLHVAPPGDPPVDLSGLEYPGIPQPAQPETATSASATSHPVTSSTFRLTANSSDRFPTSAGQLFTASGVAVTSAHARWTRAAGSTVGDDRTTADSLYFSTESALVDDTWKKVLLIVGCVLGGVVLLFLLLVAVICCVRLGRKRRRRRRRTKSVPPAVKPIREDFIRRPKPFPGISVAPPADGQPLQASALAISPSYGLPERRDLLSAEYDRNCDQLHTFERRKNGNGVNGCASSSAAELGT